MLNVRYHTISYIILASILLIITGCSSTRPLMPTPAIYQGSGGRDLFVRTVADRQTTDIKLLYITNRDKQTDPESKLPYGEGRSLSLAYGIADVEMMPDLSWASLKQQSHLATRTRDVNLELGAVNELGRFPDEPYPLKETSSGVERSSDTLRAHKKTRAGFQAELKQQLTLSPSKKVILYVHGFNDNFARAAFTTADLCHFFGREDVCTFFTWPASSTGNFLTSYTTTTESAEFSVGHLRKVIRMIAQTPEVEGIQLLAHSRGSVVLLSALRELLIESLAYGANTAEYLKIINIILMAPDIDIDVAWQKLEVFSSDPDLISHMSSQKMPRILKGRITVYSSPEDRALYAAKVLFRSRNRAGELTEDQIPVKKQEQLSRWGNFELIVYKGKRTDRFGHTYFTSNPKVSSDLIQLVRYGRKAGSPGRPLKQAGPVVWTFPEE